jgi:hypothetical protein
MFGERPRRYAVETNLRRRPSGQVWQFNNPGSQACRLAAALDVSGMPLPWFVVVRENHHRSRATRDELL